MPFASVLNSIEICRVAFQDKTCRRTQRQTRNSYFAFILCASTEKLYMHKPRWRTSDVIIPEQKDYANAMTSLNIFGANVGFPTHVVVTVKIPKSLKQIVIFPANTSMLFYSEMTTCFVLKRHHQAIIT